MECADTFTCRRRETGITLQTDHWTSKTGTGTGKMRPSLLKAVDAPKKPKRRRKAVAFPTGGERADVPEASEVTRGEEFSSMIEGVGSSNDESKYHPYAEE